MRVFSFLSSTLPASPLVGIVRHARQKDHLQLYSSTDNRYFMYVRIYTLYIIRIPEYRKSYVQFTFRSCSFSGGLLTIIVIKHVIRYVTRYIVDKRGRRKKRGRAVCVRRGGTAVPFCRRVNPRKGYMRRPFRIHARNYNPRRAAKSNETLGDIVYSRTR